MAAIYIHFNNPMALALIKHQLLKQGVKYFTANTFLENCIQTKRSVHNGNKSLTKGLVVRN